MTLLYSSRPSSLLLADLHTESPHRSPLSSPSSPSSPCPRQQAPVPQNTSTSGTRVQLSEEDRVEVEDCAHALMVDGFVRVRQVLKAVESVVGPGHISERAVRAEFDLAPGVIGQVDKARFMAYMASNWAESSGRTCAQDLMPGSLRLVDVVRTYRRRTLAERMAKALQRQLLQAQEEAAAPHRGPHAELLPSLGMPSSAARPRYKSSRGCNSMHERHTSLGPASPSAPPEPHPPRTPHHAPSRPRLGEERRMSSQGGRRHSVDVSVSRSVSCGHPGSGSSPTPLSRFRRNSLLLLEAAVAANKRPQPPGSQDGSIMTYVQQNPFPLDMPSRLSSSPGAVNWPGTGSYTNAEVALASSLYQSTSQPQPQQQHQPQSQQQQSLQQGEEQQLPQQREEHEREAVEQRLSPDPTADNASALSSPPSALPPWLATLAEQPRKAPRGSQSDGGASIAADGWTASASALPPWLAAMAGQARPGSPLSMPCGHPDASQSAPSSPGPRSPLSPLSPLGGGGGVPPASAPSLPWQAEIAGQQQAPDPPPGPSIDPDSPSSPSAPRGSPTPRPPAPRHLSVTFSTKVSSYREGPLGDDRDPNGLGLHDGTAAPASDSGPACERARSAPDCWNSQEHGAAEEAELESAGAGGGRQGGLQAQAAAGAGAHALEGGSDAAEGGSKAPVSISMWIGRRLTRFMSREPPPGSHGASPATLPQQEQAQQRRQQGHGQPVMAQRASSGAPGFPGVSLGGFGRLPNAGGPGTSHVFKLPTSMGLQDPSAKAAKASLLELTKADRAVQDAHYKLMQKTEEKKKRWA